MSLFLIVSIFSVTTYALDHTQSTNTTTLTNHPLEQRQQSIQLQPRENKERLRIELLKSVRVIENNRYTIKTLVVESKGKTYELRQKIKELKKNLDDLSKDQLGLLKKAITEIKLQKESNDTFLKVLSEYNNKIKTARDNKELDTLLILYDEIITIQKNHETSLNNYIHLLDKILSI